MLRVSPVSRLLLLQQLLLLLPLQVCGRIRLDEPESVEYEQGNAHMRRNDFRNAFRFFADKFVHHQRHPSANDKEHDGASSLLNAYNMDNSEMEACDPLSIFDVPLTRVFEDVRDDENAFRLAYTYMCAAYAKVRLPILAPTAARESCSKKHYAFFKRVADVLHVSTPFASRWGEQKTHIIFGNACKIELGSIEAPHKPLFSKYRERNFCESFAKAAPNSALARASFGMTLCLRGWFEDAAVEITAAQRMLQSQSVSAKSSAMLILQNVKSCVAFAESSNVETDHDDNDDTAPLYSWSGHIRGTLLNSVALKMFSHLTWTRCYPIVIVTRLVRYETDERRRTIRVRRSSSHGDGSFEITVRVASLRTLTYSLSLCTHFPIQRHRRCR